MTQNPLLSPFTGPFGLAPFSQITPDHFREAFPTLMADELVEVAAIAENSAPPTFENTIAAMERTGELFSAAAGVFYNLTGAHSNEALQAVEREMAPAMSRHGNAILLNPVDHQLIGWDELWGLPVISDDRVPTKRVRIQCDGSAFGIEDEVADAVAREQPVEVPVVVPVGPGEDDMPQFDERDLPQA